MKAPWQSAFPFILQHYTYSPPCPCCNSLFQEVSWQFSGFYKRICWVFSWIKQVPGYTPESTPREPNPGWIWYQCHILEDEHQDFCVETGQKPNKSHAPWGDMRTAKGPGLEQSHLLLSPERCVHWECAGVAQTAALARKPQHHTRAHSGQDVLPGPTAFWDINSDCASRENIGTFC